jgi:hypothetical protein
VSTRLLPDKFCNLFNTEEKLGREPKPLSSNLCGFLLFSTGFYLGKILKAREGFDISPGKSGVDE